MKTIGEPGQRPFPKEQLFKTVATKRIEVTRQGLLNL